MGVADCARARISKNPRLGRLFERPSAQRAERYPMRGYRFRNKSRDIQLCLQCFPCHVSSLRIVFCEERERQKQQKKHRGMYGYSLQRATTQMIRYNNINTRRPLLQGINTQFNVKRDHETKCVSFSQSPYSILLPLLLYL